MSKDLYLRAARGLSQFLVAMALLVILPAGTLRYWQAWVFIAVFFVCTLTITAYLAINDPKLLERRMNVGPVAEKEKTQKVIMVLASIVFVATVLLPAIDHRYHWSNVPASIVILGDALIALGFGAVLYVFRENSYSASTIQVAEGQKVITTGPYAMVRHPIYGASLILMAGIPLALGSWSGLLMLVPGIEILIWRLLDEEKFLARNLPGYAQYVERVRYRLVPFVW